MTLPISPPVEPMLAKSVPTLPTGEGMLYEPKWDGFRCLVFRDGDEVELASRGGKTLTRYFPEVVAQAVAVCDALRLAAPKAMPGCADAGGDQRYFHVEVVYEGDDIADISFDVPETDAPEPLVRLWKSQV